MLAHLPLEAHCLDVAWTGGVGRMLVRFAGAAAEERGRPVAARLTGLAGVKIVTDDAELWARQRASQRATSSGGIVIKVASRPMDLAVILRDADARGVGDVARRPRLSWIALSDAANVDALRRSLAPRSCTVPTAPIACPARGPPSTRARSP